MHFNSNNVSPRSSFTKSIAQDEDEVFSNIYSLSICSENDLNPSKNKPKNINIRNSRKNSLICTDMPLISEKNWLISSNCIVCGTIFDVLKGIFTHHCRFCGISVCGKCSFKKINKERCCDICFLRTERKDLIERKEKILILKDERICTLEGNIKEMINKIQEIIKANSIIDLELINLKNQKNTEKNKLENELKNVAGILKRKMDNVENFKKNIENEEKLLEQKQDEQRILVKKIKDEKDDILKKQIKLKRLNGDKTETLNQLKKIKISQSYYDLSDLLDLTPEDLQKTFNQIDFTVNEGNLLENCDVDIQKVLKKTINFNKKSYASHSLMKGKKTMSDQQLKAYEEGCLKEKCNIF